MRVWDDTLLHQRVDVITFFSSYFFFFFFFFVKMRFFRCRSVLFSGLLGRQTPEAKPPKFYLCIRINVYISFFPFFLEATSIKRIQS